MDFKRIEIIFLCAFLSLNVFLWYTFRQGAIEPLPTAGVNAVQPIEQRLKSDKISFATDFSEEVTAGYYLSAAPTDFADGQARASDNQRWLRTLEATAQTLLDRGKIDNELANLIRQNHAILFAPDYTYLNKKASDTTKYIFSQKYEGIPFYDETSELAVEIEEVGQAQLRVKSYSQSHLAEIEPLREKQEVISERDAIATLYTSNRIPSEGQIAKTQLAYTRIFTVRGKNIYIPAWFVWIETSKKNSQIERVNAFTNSIISANVAEVKK